MSCPIPLDLTVSEVIGIPFVIVGCTLLFAGIWEFRSLRQVSGLEASGLVTTGIYRYSWNPQYLGWFLHALI